MDHRYVDTVRAMKLVTRNLELLDGEVTLGQRAELERLIHKLKTSIEQFLSSDMDEGLWIGEE